MISQRMSRPCCYATPIVVSSFAKALIPVSQKECVSMQHATVSWMDLGRMEERIETFSTSLGAHTFAKHCGPPARFMRRGCLHETSDCKLHDEVSLHRQHFLDYLDAQLCENSPEIDEGKEPAVAGQGFQPAQEQVRQLSAGGVSSFQFTLNAVIEKMVVFISWKWIEDQCSDNNNASLGMIQGI